MLSIGFSQHELFLLKRAHLSHLNKFMDQTYNIDLWRIVHGCWWNWKNDEPWWTVSELFQGANVHSCLDFRFKTHPTVWKLLMNSQNELTSELSATSPVGCSLVRGQGQYSSSSPIPPALSSPRTARLVEPIHVTSCVTKILTNWNHVPTYVNIHHRVPLGFTNTNVVVAFKEHFINQELASKYVEKI